MESNELTAGGRGSTTRDERPAEIISAFVGAAAAYVTIEIFVTEILRWLSYRRLFVPTYKPFAIASFCTYIAAGLLIGIVAVFVTRRLRGRTGGSDRAAALTLCVAFAVNALIHVHAAVVPVLIVNALLIALLMRRRLTTFVTPLAVSLLLLVPDWVANDYFVRSRSLVRIAAFAVATAIVAALVWAAARALTRVRLPATAIQLVIAIAFLLIALALPYAPARAEPVSVLRRSRDLPNVLLVVMDTVRADHLSLYGYARDTTPRLRELANHSTVYTAAIAPANVTLTTHASLFTGLYPSEHRAHYDKGWPGGRPLQTGIPTLAEVFARRGYDVSSIAANHFYFAPDFGLARGFAYHFSQPPPSTLSAIGRNSAYHSPRLPRLTAPKKHLLGYSIWALICGRLGLWNDLPDTIRADDITRRAVERVEHAKSVNRPFFLFVNYLDAHAPYLPPPPYDRLFPGKRETAPVGLFDDISGAWFQTGRLDLTTADREHLVSQYDGTITFTDHHLGRLIDELRRRNVYDNTIIVITSDHGEALGEHTSIGHASTMFNEQVHVPLIIKAAAQRQATRVSDFVSIVDVFRLLTNGTPLPTGQAFMEAFPLTATDIVVGAAKFKQLPAVYRNGRSIFSNGWKLMLPSSNRAVELYDLTTDPRELRNAALADPQRVMELQRALEQWIRLHPPRITGETKPFDRETEQQLRAIGYIH